MVWCVLEPKFGFASTAGDGLSLFGFFGSSGCKFMFERLLLIDFGRISVRILFNFFFLNVSSI